MLDTPVFDSALRHYKELFEEETESRYVPRARLDLVQENFVKSNSESSIGLRRLRTWEQLLETGFSTSRHKFDRTLHAGITQIMAPVLVGEEEWATLGPGLCSARGWKGNSKCLGAMTARRMGKTFGATKAMAATAYVMLKMEGIQRNQVYTQTVFSTNSRTSKSLRSYWLRHARELGLGDYIITENQEQVVLRLDKEDNESPTLIANFLPSGSKKYVLIFCMCSCVVVLMCLLA